MPSLLTCARIAEDVYHDRPTVVDAYSPLVVPDHEIYCAGREFAGGASAGRERVGVIAFRGTREMEDWKGANADILRRRMPVNQVGSALAFFAAAHRALARAGCERHLVVGHSLGGALAAVIASTVTWVPVRGVTFNAPGLGEFQARLGNGASDLDLPRANADNVMNFRSASDIVSHWGLHIGKTYDVPGTRRHGIRAMIACLDVSDMGGWSV
jgi:pimeloyl-ACP methyl ester carboxylesterase